MSIHIRPATIDDIPRLVELRKEIADYHIAKQTFYQLHANALTAFATHLEQLIQDDNHYIPVLCKNNEICGHAIVRLSKAPSVFTDRISGYIEEFYIIPAMQRKGFGETLLNDVYSWFNNHKIERVVLDVLAVNTQGVNFWRKHGFGESHLTMTREV